MSCMSVCSVACCVGVVAGHRWWCPLSIVVRRSTAGRKLEETKRVVVARKDCEMGPPKIFRPRNSRDGPKAACQLEVTVQDERLVVLEAQHGQSLLGSLMRLRKMKNQNVDSDRTARQIAAVRVLVACRRLSTDFYESSMTRYLSVDRYQRGLHPFRFTSPMRLVRTLSLSS